MLLAASGDVTMQRELANFLQSEAKESQERSVAKVHGWLQSQAFEGSKHVFHPAYTTSPDPR